MIKPQHNLKNKWLLAAVVLVSALLGGFILWYINKTPEYTGIHEYPYTCEKDGRTQTFKEYPAGQGYERCAVKD